MVALKKLNNITQNYINQPNHSKEATTIKSHIHLIRKFKTYLKFSIITVQDHFECNNEIT